MNTPHIYVACLAAYNSGFLHGQWIDATQDVEQIHSEISAMLADSPVECTEEWAIHDFEGFGNLHLDEYESIDHVVKLAEFIVSHGEVGTALLVDYTIEEAEACLSNHYHGAYDNEVDFAYAFFDKCYGYVIPENLSYYALYGTKTHEASSIKGLG